MVLLTGATGFLGSFVLDELLQHGYEVTALFRTENDVIGRYPNVQWIRTDLGKANTLEKLPVTSDGIIHLASTLSIQPEIVMKVDIPAMWRLLQRWDQGPFVYISSTDIYGRLNTIPADEEHPLAPSNWYGLGKMFCEQQLQMMARMKSRADFVIFRPPYILGPHKCFSRSVVGRLIKRAMEGADFVLPGKKSGGTASGHSWVDAHDLARWTVSALHEGFGEIYNTTSGFTTWEKLLNLILGLTGGSSKIIFKGNGDKTLNLCTGERHFSNERFNRVFHTKDVHHLEQTLVKVINEIRTNK